MCISDMSLLPVFMSSVGLTILASILVSKPLVSGNTRYRDTKKRDSKVYDNIDSHPSNSHEKYRGKDNRKN